MNTLACPRCGVIGTPTVDWRTFSNGTTHIEARCKACNAYIKYLPQLEPWISLLPPLHEGGTLQPEGHTMSWDQYEKDAEVGGGGDFPEVADDLYDAIIQDVTEPRTGPDNFNPGKERTDFIVKWELTSGDVPPGTVLWQYVNLPADYLSSGYLNEKANLYKLMDALGFDLTGRFKVQPSQWQGMEARVMVENRATQGGDMRPRITGVKAPRQKRAAPKPVAAGAGRSRPAEGDWKD